MIKDLIKDVGPAILIMTLWTLITAFLCLAWD